MLYTVAMFIIFGTRTREKVTGARQFYCSKCGTKRDGKQKRLGKWFTLFFIPIFQYEKLGEFVECDVCHRAYKSFEGG